MPAKPQFLLSVDRGTQQWRNGGGTTAQVAIEPRRATTENFDWRVSIATVDGEALFSRYPGVTRWLMPLAPGGISLRIEGEVHYLPSREAFAIGGDASVSATRIREPILDINLMIRNAVTRGSLVALVFGGPSEITTEKNEAAVLIVLDGDISIDDIALSELDAVKLAPKSRVTVTGHGVVAVARITRR